MGIFDSLFSGKKKKDDQELENFTEHSMNHFDRRRALFLKFKDDLLITNYNKGLTYADYLRILDEKGKQYDHDTKMQSIKFSHTIKLPGDEIIEPDIIHPTVRLTYSKKGEIGSQSFICEYSSYVSGVVELFDFYKNSTFFTKQLSAPNLEDDEPQPDILLSDDNKFRVILSPGQRNDRSLVIQFM